MMMMRKFVIEREVPGIGGQDPAGMGQAAKVSNGALARLDGIQWQHSYVTGDKTFCIYLAESEEKIREHARLSGFPANQITEVTEVIDPTTERQCARHRRRAWPRRSDRPDGGAHGPATPPAAPAAAAFSSGLDQTTKCARNFERSFPPVVARVKV